jgi:hypothetical protein
MGAIHNKTVNYYTSRDSNDPTSDCYADDGSDLSKEVYRKAKTVTPGSLVNKLELRHMGSKKDYWVKWYKPFTGYYYPTTSATTSFFGNLKLDSPPNLWKWRQQCFVI